MMVVIIGFVLIRHPIARFFYVVALEPIMHQDMKGFHETILQYCLLGGTTYLDFTFVCFLRYTVTFNDGDIATLRRTALCMKSGKHYNASESLDKLPLTHPEHFSTPVGHGAKGRRRNRSGAG